MRFTMKPGLLGAALAIVVMSSSELILIFGAIGSAGNKYITGAFLGGTLLTVALLGLNELPKWNFGDVLFATILVGIVASFLDNPWVTDKREFLLLLVSLSAYAACRSISVKQLSTIRTAIKLTAACIVLLGTFFTCWALVGQWNNPHGHPFVFGFDAGATEFAYCLGLWILAFICEDLTKKRTLILCVSLVLPAAVFGASLVRFVFIAVFGAMLINIFLSRDQRQRAYVMAIAVTILFSAGLGSAVRYQTSILRFSNVIPIEGDQPNPTLKKQKAVPDKALPLPSVKPAFAPSCVLQINKNDSVAIRKALLGDAFFFAQRAGPLGFGLDSFSEYSCVGSFEVHNSLMQAIVEFGWIAGGALIALIGYAGLFNWQLARRDPNVRFFLCCLAYLVALSMVYGRTSREMPLFAIIGLSIGIIGTAKTLTRAPALG